MVLVFQKPRQSDRKGEVAEGLPGSGTKSPVRENCTPGSVRGLSGDWQSYRDPSNSCRLARHA